VIPPSLDFRRLKKAVSIEQVLAQRGLLDGLRLRGHRLVGPCPVHGGDNPRAFVVDRHKGLWRCYAKSTVMLIRGLPRVERAVFSPHTPAELFA